MQSQFNALANGTTVENLNTDLVKGVNIIVPSIELQNEFADYAKFCDKLKFEVQKLVKNHLKKNIYKISTRVNRYSSGTIILLSFA